MNKHELIAQVNSNIAFANSVRHSCPISWNEYVILDSIREAALTIKDISKLTGKPQQSVGKVISGLLTQENYVTSVVSEDDKRSMIISITKKGREAVAKVDAFVKHEYEEVKDL